MTRNSTTFDAVVIGSGLGGLSAAAHLSVLGKRVLLLERYKIVGGCSHAFRRRGAWEFDAGVHYIGETGPDGVVRQLMRGLAVDDIVEWMPLDPTGFDIVRGPGLEYRIPVGWDAWQHNILDTFPQERRALARYTSILRGLGEYGDRASDFGSYKAFAKAIARTGRYAPFAPMPHAALLATCGVSAKTTLALSISDAAIATTPLQMPSFGAASLRQHFTGGSAHYPRGGGQMLDAAFVEVIRSHGGTVRTNAEVTRIVIEGGRVAGVDLGTGEHIRSRVVVSDADIVRTYRDLIGIENLPRRTRLRMSRWALSKPLINGFFGVKLDATTLPNSNVFSIPSWDDASSHFGLVRLLRSVVDGKGYDGDGTAWARDMARRQPMFVQCSTTRDPSNTRSAPTGHAAIEVQTIVPSDPALWGFDNYDVSSGEYRTSARYQDIKKIVLDGMIDRMEQAYPGAAANIVFGELATPATQEFYTHSEQGTAFGLASTVMQGGPLREGPRGPVPGLFLAGSSTPFGPGTAGAMVSGLQAAAAIVGRPLLDEVRGGSVLADPTRIAAWPSDFDPLDPATPKALSRE